MNTADLLDAFDLPASACVDQRVPKKLLVENGSPTTADKRHINEGIEDIHWLAALKPTTVGVQEYRDEAREYLEIAVLGAALREGANTRRLTELIHRAVPYPVLLIQKGNDGLSLSLAHKRWAQNESGKVVLDGESVEVNLTEQQDNQRMQAFLDALALSSQPRTNLLALYQGWIDTLIAYQVAGKTGRFVLADGPEQAVARRDALHNYQKLEAQITALRTVAGKERQLARQVELNLEIKRAQGALNAILEKLTQGSTL